MSSSANLSPKKPSRALDILALEPWYAGSHRGFLDGLIAHSAHHIHPITLPGRFWKWRQTGSGLVLAQRVRDQAEAGLTPPNLIFASDFLHLPDFLALTRRQWPNVPAILYFHENQLTYPLEEGHQLDPAYPQANLSGAAVADQVWFNSAHHQRVFFEGLERLLKACPDFAPHYLAEEIGQKSRVLPLGVDLDSLTPHFEPRRNRQGPLTVLWNHRWEHDKNPEAFFRTLFDLSDAGREFRLIVLGQAFRQTPKIFTEAQTRLTRHIDHWGYAESRADYARLLGQADVVVSVARHDFFGVSVVEAMHAGCLPLLAHRLNYPDLIPQEAHPRCLLERDEDLTERLAELIQNPQRVRDAAAPDGGPTAWAAAYEWAQRATDFDAAFSAAFSAAFEAHPRP
ncbi:MAG: DUF3524 domain-containing protein [Nitrospirota bacterium]|nr:DUF3524 domain-containing protein [Nitrospirota bacterium]